MNRLQKLLPHIPSIIIKEPNNPRPSYLPHNPNALHVINHPQGCNGLLEMIQPLIAYITHLKLVQDSSLSFGDVAKKYIISFIQNSPVAVSFLDLNLNFIAHSPKWATWFKQHLSPSETPAELPEHNFLELTKPCPRIIQTLLKNNIKGMSEFRPHLEYTVKKQKRCIRWESFPWFDQNHIPLGIVVFCEDITKIQQLALRNKKLEQSNQMLENFALMFSHDLIQPMRQMSNFISLLQDQLIKLNIKDSSIDYAFSAINKSLIQINNLSEGIILYCRKGDLKSQPETVPLNQIIEEVTTSCLINNQFNLTIRFEEDINLYANKTSILQLFQNLLINAVKHSSSENPTITLEGKKLENNFCQVTIHNHGTYPSRYIRKHLFDPFCSSNTDGAGLGLMICKKIVNAYKGTIHLRSSLRHGTMVTLTLPLSV